MLRDSIVVSNEGYVTMTDEKGIIHVRIQKELAKKFRIEVTRLYGGERGALSRAIKEAIESWLKEKK
jgi:tRNA threonylcarbamoyladenosine modification (KEOPS) complex Cgi121 subunit